MNDTTETTTEESLAAKARRRENDTRDRKGHARVRREAAKVRLSIKRHYKDRTVGIRTRYENPETQPEEFAWASLQVVNVRNGNRSNDELADEAEAILKLLRSEKGAHDFKALPLERRGRCLVLNLNRDEIEHLDALAAKEEAKKAGVIFVDRDEEEDEDDNLFFTTEDDAHYGSAPTSAPQTVSLAGVTPRLAAHTPAATPPRDSLESTEVSPDAVESSNAQLGYKPAAVSGFAPFRGFAHQRIDLD